MKKCFRVLSVAILILIAISTFTIGAFAAEECNHEFVFSVEAWGATTHSGKCSGCNMYVEAAPHFYTSDGFCGACGYGCEHSDFSDVSYSDEKGHSGVCGICGVQVFEKHDMTDWDKLNDDKHVSKCTESKCSYQVTEEHEDSDKNGKCDDCGFKAVSSEVQEKLSEMTYEQVIGAALGAALVLGIVYLIVNIVKSKRS